MVGSLEGGLLDVVVNAAGWTFVAWVATRQPSVLLIALPAAAVVGLLVGSLVSCTSGAFLGTRAFWAFGGPARSPRRRFSFRLLDELVRDELSKKILIFLLAFPFMLVGVVIVAGAGYLVAGDAGAGIGAVAGMLLGVLCALRYFLTASTRGSHPGNCSCWPS